MEHGNEAKNRRSQDMGGARASGRLSVGTMRNELDLLHLPLYSYAECDHLAAMTRGTSKRWIEGYEYWNLQGDRVARPPVTEGTRKLGGISFLGLIEIRAIGNLKDAGFSLREIRDIVLNCQQILRVDHPLVTLKFKTSGREIFVHERGEIVEVGKRRGQHAWYDFLAPFLQDVEYEHRLARRWYPLGVDKLVVVDPDYGYGLPVVKQSGIRTEIVFERFRVTGSIHEVSEDFKLRPEEVEQAIQFESTLVKKRAA